jgi:hypothetical protein
MLSSKDGPGTRYALVLERYSPLQATCPLSQSLKRDPCSIFGSNFVLLIPKSKYLSDIWLNNLGLIPQNLTTKQVALMILGWSRGESETKGYHRLEERLKSLMPGQALELDYRLYARTCKWNLDHQSGFVKTSLDQNLESLMINLNIARNFNLPKYKDWLNNRNVAEEMEYTAELDTKVELRSVLLFLKSLEVPALTFRRPPFKLSCARRN